MMSDGFFAIERSFWCERRRANMLLVHYNDLKADLSGDMKRIADFLGIETPDELWPQLVEAASFEAMKRDGGVLMAGASVPSGTVTRRSCTVAPTTDGLTSLQTLTSNFTNARSTRNCRPL